jgi:hypothetical protein
MSSVELRHGGGFDLACGYAKLMHEGDPHNLNSFVAKTRFLSLWALSGRPRAVSRWFSGDSCALRTHLNQRDLLLFVTILTKSPSATERQAMAHNYAINDDVHHLLQGPQGRANPRERSVYTIVACLPIEADRRPRYRIKSKTENVERVVTEEQISRLG